MQQPWKLYPTVQVRPLARASDTERDGDASDGHTNPGGLLPGTFTGTGVCQGGCYVLLKSLGTGGSQSAALHAAPPTPVTHTQSLPPVPCASAHSGPDIVSIRVFWDCRVLCKRPVLASGHEVPAEPRPPAARAGLKSFLFTPPVCCEESASGGDLAAPAPRPAPSASVACACPPAMPTPNCPPPLATFTSFLGPDR